MTDRYSLEIRLWARDDALLKYGDRSIRINRLDGVPVVTETRCSPGVRAHGFVVSTALMAMQTVCGLSTEVKRESRLASPHGLMASLRGAARRLVP
ncbi:MAG: hypothetical protein GEV13_13195 [Rhodospirillales bacterium]|nr:hypothetical protein [Rhodospirillales bacterium]